MNKQPSTFSSRSATKCIIAVFFFMFVVLLTVVSGAVRQSVAEARIGCRLIAH